MNDQSLILKVERARWYALGNLPFYGSLAMGLQDVMSNPHGKTACTDGKRIFWDRDFLGKLTDEETRFVLLHETMHPAHSHLWRLPADERGNMAGDYAINGTLSKLPGIKMPAGGLLNPAFDGLAEEEILNRLPEPPKGGKGSGSGSGSSCGDFAKPADGEGEPSKGDSGPNKGQGQGKTPPDGQNPAESKGQAGNDRNESLEDQWKERVIQAAQAAKALGQGNCPSDLQRIIDRTLNQKVDYRQETADFIKDRIASRNDWSRSSRRMAYQPVIYPRKRSDDTGLIIACRDTSGSIGQETLAEFNGLIAACMAETNCSAIVMDVDAQIHTEHRVEPGEAFPNEAKGGGGTDFRCVSDRIRELLDAGERIAGVVFCTDLAASFPEDFCDVATLWLATTDAQAPFGRTVRIEA
jgi:predicted metal-dependent peptidase